MAPINSRSSRSFVTATYLTSGVDHLNAKVLVLVFDDFRECVLYGGVVRVDKMTVDELHCEGALACRHG